MKIGRNASCPCGSGKKYKKCCLAKDEPERQLMAALTTPEPSEPEPSMPEPVSAPSPAPPPDPHMEAINARWEEFEAQDYEGRLAVFMETLDEPELMDDEMAFEMLNSLHSQMLERDQRDRFDGLIETLHTRLPEVYESRAHYYLNMRITHLLDTGRFEALSPLLKDLANTDEHDIDMLNRVIDALAYHGQLALLLGTMHDAWPWVQEPGNVVPWGIDEFSTQAIHCVLLAYSQQTAEPDPNDPILVEQLAYYHPIDPEYVQQFLTHLTAQIQRDWSLDDFDFQPRRQRRQRDMFDAFDEDDAEPAPLPVDLARRNLFNLSIEFLGYLHRDANVPLSKGELARCQLIEYILQRFDGRLEPQESLFDLEPRRSKKRRRKSKRRQPSHALCPDQETLDRFLGGMLNFINPQFYKAAATFELLPAWLRFLESRGLIDAAKHRETSQMLRSLIPSMRQIWENRPDDRSLLQGLQTCWESEESGTPM